MSQENAGTSVEIMGKMYHVKCPETEFDSLRQAASYIEDHVRKMRENGVLSAEKAIIITALNVVHQLLKLQHEKNEHVDRVNQRLLTLHEKVEEALFQAAQMELSSAE